MNKKGNVIPTYLVGELILVVLLVIIFGNIITDTSDQDFLDQVVTAEDIAKTLDVAQSTPYDFKYEYPETLGDFVIHLDGSSVYLLSDKEELPAGFSFKKRIFSVRNDLSLPKNQEVDASYFYVLKEGDSLKLGDYSTSKSVKVFSVSKKSRPNLSIDVEKSSNAVTDKILEKLSLAVLSEAQVKFTFGQSNKIRIILSAHKTDVSDKNIVYYSIAGQDDVKPIAENLQQIMVDELNLLAIPLAKNYGQEKVVEISLLNSFDNMNLFDDLNYRRRFGSLIIESFNYYYGVN